MKLTKGEFKLMIKECIRELVGEGDEPIKIKVYDIKQKEHRKNEIVVFLDMDWTVASHEQGEDRTHRIGQKSSVQIYYMICEDTIDEYMRDMLKQKQEINVNIQIKLVKI
jgi:hypothetical protein